MMTREEFNKTRFSANMNVSYRGGKYGVVSVNFYEALLGIIDGEVTGDESADDLTWVRCESVELLP